VLDRLLVFQGGGWGLRARERYGVLVNLSCLDVFFQRCVETASFIDSLITISISRVPHGVAPQTLDAPAAHCHVRGFDVLPLRTFQVASGEANRAYRTHPDSRGYWSDHTVGLCKEDKPVRFRVKRVDLSKVYSDTPRKCCPRGFAQAAFRRPLNLATLATGRLLPRRNSEIF